MTGPNKLPSSAPTTKPHQLTTTTNDQPRHASTTTTSSSTPSVLVKTRMMRELDMLQMPPPGISVWSENDSLMRLSAVVEGLAGSPYEKGKFRLDIQIPQRFPFEPPCIQFVTPIYHPNVDTRGRICLDILKLPPKGSWRPSVHLSGVLNSIRLLMLEPNPDDPLLDEIAAEFKSNYALFCRKARAACEAQRRVEAVGGDRQGGMATIGSSTPSSSSSLETTGSSSSSAMATVAAPAGRMSFKALKAAGSKRRRVCDAPAEGHN